MKTLVIIVCLVCAPAAAFTQAAIAGTVKDSSGAVLPGVVVEASSPGLIEKTRIAVTDAAGRYRIDDLRPGTFCTENPWYAARFANSSKNRKPGFIPQS